MLQEEEWKKGVRHLFSRFFAAEGATMFKLISITIRLVILAAVLATVQKAILPMQRGKNNGISEITALLANGAKTSSKTSTESPGILGLLSGKGIDPKNCSTLTAVPQLMKLIQGERGEALESTTTQPPRTTGRVTIIRYREADAKRTQKAGATVTKLPPEANATVVDGRVQIFYPAGKPKESK
jgi:hypothetical protein